MKTSRSPGRVSLPRALSKLGFASRSQAVRLIASGEVTINGRMEKNPHRWIDLTKDRIEIRSEILKRQPFRYVMLHKPKGIVTTRLDDRGGETVFDLIGEIGDGLNAVGRLDKDSTGLLLFTNDHQLAHRLTSPQTGLSKTYSVRLDRPIDAMHLQQLSEGMEIRIGARAVLTRPAQIARRQASEIDISISEGKNRQIRRMLEELGYEVIHLHRISIGPLVLGVLKEGHCRELTPSELSALKESIGVNNAIVPRRKSLSRFRGRKPGGNDRK